MENLDDLTIHYRRRQGFADRHSLFSADHRVDHPRAIIRNEEKHDFSFYVISSSLIEVDG